MLVFLIALLVGPGPGWADELKVPEPKIPFDPRFYVCYRVQKPVALDGKIDDASWKKAEWTESFVDIEGANKARPRFRTRVKMLWDDQYLYIAGDLEEPAVWATRKERDSVVYDDNDFEIFIDPDGDTHKYCEIELNALNTVWDILLLKPYRDDSDEAVSSWDIRGLKTAVSVHGTLNNPIDKDKGWTLEVAIPWADLREFAPKKKERPDSGDQWRMNFSRVEYSVTTIDGRYAKAKDPASGVPYAEDNWTWSPQGLINVHYPEMWGFVQFSDKIVGKGEELFADAFVEPVKWALREIYYRERAYRDANGSFTTDLAALGLGFNKALKIGGWDYPPLIQTTASFFEAIYRNEDGGSWHIRQDGLVWRSDAQVQ